MNLLEISKDLLSLPLPNAVYYLGLISKDHCVYLSQKIPARRFLVLSESLLSHFSQLLILLLQFDGILLVPAYLILQLFKLLLGGDISKFYLCHSSLQFFSWNSKLLIFSACSMDWAEVF